MHRGSKSRAGTGRKRDLRRLAEEIRGILRKTGTGGAASSALPTGWPAFDAVLAKRSGCSEGGLARGAVHEWLGVGDGRSWSPPLFLAAHLAQRALAGEEERSVLWIGRRIWPYPRALVRDFGLRLSATVPSETALEAGRVELVRLKRAERVDPFRLLERSFLVDAEDPAQRLWAIAAALRTSSAGLVVADGSRFNMAATRRLQLAAEEKGGLVLLLRGAREERVISAAMTRWRVRWTEPLRDVACPAWTLELLREKSVLGSGKDLLEPSCDASSR